MTTTLVASVLATNNFGDTREGKGPAGPIALLIILVLAAVTIFLIRNMNSRLRRLPDRFSGSAARSEGGHQAPGAGPSAAAPDGGSAPDRQSPGSPTRDGESIG